MALTVIAITGGFLSKRLKDKKRFTFWVLLAECVFIVICSTVVFRAHMAIARWELMPFWTYQAVMDHVPGVSVWDIVLNIVLFLPLGFLVKLLKPSLSFLWMMGIALCLSVFIESNQFFFEKGAAQIDDVLHNVIGALLGWLIAKGCIRLKEAICSRQ